jgi:hypothetical protein
MPVMLSVAKYLSIFSAKARFFTPLRFIQNDAGAALRTNRQGCIYTPLGLSAYFLASRPNARRSLWASRAARVMLPWCLRNISST